jgi:aspartate kinase
MIIMKFGGSSVKDSERIKSVAEIIRSSLKRSPVIVFSAMGKTTDWLLDSGNRALRERSVDLQEIRNLHLQCAQDLDVPAAELEGLFRQLQELLMGITLIQELSPRTLDFLVSFGERLSVRLIASYLSKIGIPARYFDAWDIGLVTTSHFQNASVLPESFERIRGHLGNLKKEYAFTPVVTGFIGKEREGSITTLGRGGSDLTASLLGNALDVEEVQVWKDVDGLMTTDPKIVPEAGVVEEISFEEASELAYFGAKILHPQSIVPAMEKNIPVRVKNSYAPEAPGTVIKNSVDEKTLVKVITFQRNITLIDIVSSRMLGLSGFLAHVFQVFAKHDLSVDMIASSEISISLTLNKNARIHACFPALLSDLKEIASVEASREKAMVTIVGDVKRSTETLARVFKVLRDEKIMVQMVGQGASKVNMSLIIDNNELDRAVKALHRAFFNDAAQCSP